MWFLYQRHSIAVAFFVHCFEVFQPFLPLYLLYIRFNIAPAVVRIQIQGDSQRQYVCMFVRMKICSQYPDSPNASSYAWF